MLGKHDFKQISLHYMYKITLRRNKLVEWCDNNALVINIKKWEIVFGSTSDACTKPVVSYT